MPTTAVRSFPYLAGARVPAVSSIRTTGHIDATTLAASALLPSVRERDRMIAAAVGPCLPANERALAQATHLTARLTGLSRERLNSYERFLRQDRMIGRYARQVGELHRAGALAHLREAHEVARRSVLSTEIEPPTSHRPPVALPQPEPIEPHASELRPTIVVRHEIVFPPIDLPALLDALASAAAENPETARRLLEAFGVPSHEDLQRLFLDLQPSRFDQTVAGLGLAGTLLAFLQQLAGLQ